MNLSEWQWTIVVTLFYDTNLQIFMVTHVASLPYWKQHYAMTQYSSRVLNADSINKNVRSISFGGGGTLYEIIYIHYISITILCLYTRISNIFFELCMNSLNWFNYHWNATWRKRYLCWNALNSRVCACSARCLCISEHHLTRIFYTLLLSSDW